MMNEMTIRLPLEFKPRLAALAGRHGLKPAEFARKVLIEAINDEERRQHQAAMQAMVEQAIANREVRDEALESASLEALAEDKD